MRMTRTVSVTRSHQGSLCGDVLRLTTECPHALSVSLRARPAWWGHSFAVHAILLPSACGCPCQLSLPVGFKKSAGKAAFRVDSILLLKKRVNSGVGLPQAIFVNV